MNARPCMQGDCVFVRKAVSLQNEMAFYNATQSIF
jgi:hypothetical protein